MRVFVCVVYRFVGACVVACVSACGCDYDFVCIFQVILAEPTAVQLVALPRFGTQKCEHADAPGRWIDMHDKLCAPPYCSGRRRPELNDMDWVLARETVLSSILPLLSYIVLPIRVHNLAVSVVFLARQPPSSY